MYRFAGLPEEKLLAAYEFLACLSSFAPHARAAEMTYLVIVRRNPRSSKKSNGILDRNISTRCLTGELYRLCEYVSFGVFY